MTIGDGLNKLEFRRLVSLGEYIPPDNPHFVNPNHFVNPRPGFAKNTLSIPLGPERFVDKVGSKIFMFVLKQPHKSLIMNICD